MIINSSDDIIVLVDGRELKVNEDYTLVNSELTFKNPPQPNEKIQILKRENVKTDN